MLTLDRSAVAAALPRGALVDALDSAFRDAAGTPPRTHHSIPLPEQADATLLLMPAWQSGRGLGVKVATVFPDNAARGLPSVNASYLLLDPHSGTPLAVLDGAELTLRRTAAASALASRYLSRDDARTLLMVGTGKLAPHLVAAHASVRPLDRILVWGRRAEAARAVAAALPELDIAIDVVDDLRGAVAHADIISCATLAVQPLVHGAWLGPGQHLDLVGAFRPDMREADNDAVAAADVYVDTYEGALGEAGEIVQSIADGYLARAGICADLHELCSGRRPGRRDPDALTLFKSVGCSLEDLAAAMLVWTRHNET